MFSKEEGLESVLISVVHGRGGTDMDQISKVTLIYEDGTEKDVTKSTDVGMHFYRKDLIEYLGVDEAIVEEYSVD